MADEEKDLSPDTEKVEREEIEEAEDIESVRKALEEEKEKAEKYLANWQRAEADLINLKRRTEQQRTEVANFANAMLILNLLPVLDDLERALESVSAKLAGLSWVDGIRIIYRKLQAVLEAQGLSAIEAEGKDFDPNFHEAIIYGDGEEGKVVEELQKGYKLRDRVIRPTMVKVGKGKESSESVEEEQP